MVFAENIAPEWNIGAFGPVPCVVPVFTGGEPSVGPSRLLIFKVNHPVLRYCWTAAGDKPAKLKDRVADIS